jgi:hypothetical protein
MLTQSEAKQTVRKLTRGNLANIQGAALILGCCTQGCCKADYRLELSEQAPS